MNAWLTARRVKKGQVEDFRKKWRGGDLPEGMLDAFLLEDEEDPHETLSVSFWDTAKDLLEYRTSEDAKKRRDDLSDVVDKERWSRNFVAFSADDIKVGGGKKWLLLPLLLVGVGAALYFFLSRRNQGEEDEWDTWQPESASTFQPGEARAPVTPTAANASPATPPPAVRPLEAESRNGGEGRGGSGGGTDHGARHERTGEVMGQQPASLQSGAQSSMPAAGTVAPQSTERTSTTEQRTGTSETQARGATPSSTLGASAMHTASAAPAATPASTSTRTSAGRGQQETRRRTVRELMTANPETVDQKTDVVAAARLMRDLDVGVLPVTADDRLAGVITDRDIAIAFAERTNVEPASVKVMDLMTQTPRTVTPDTSVEEAARIMADAQVRRLPVVDGTRLVGIVSLGDLAAEGAQGAAAGALHEISEPASPDQ